MSAVATLAACGGDGGPTGPGATVVGTYSISTVNGKALPVALYPADPLFMYEVTVGALTLTADGNFSVVTTYRQTIPGNVSVIVDSTHGTWVLTGTNVAFAGAQDTSMHDTAVWDKDQLTFAEKNGKVTPLSLRFGPKAIAKLPQTQDVARLSSAVDPMTYVYKKT